MPKSLLLIKIRNLYFLLLVSVLVKSKLDTFHLFIYSCAHAARAHTSYCEKYASRTATPLSNGVSRTFPAEGLTSRPNDQRVNPCGIPDKQEFKSTPNFYLYSGQCNFKLVHSFCFFSYEIPDKQELKLTPYFYLCLLQK